MEGKNMSQIIEEHRKNNFAKIERPDKDNKYGSGNFLSTPEKQEDVIFDEIVELLKNNKWIRAFDLLEESEQRADFLSVDFYKKLNEFLINHNFPQDDNFELDGFARIFFDKCLEKIATQKGGADYFLSLFDENRVSGAVLTSFGSTDFIDAEPIVSYYNAIAKTILKTGDPRHRDIDNFLINDIITACKLNEIVNGIAKVTIFLMQKM
jgi:hypothetical protein